MRPQNRIMFFIKGNGKAVAGTCKDLTFEQARIEACKVSHAHDAVEVNFCYNSVEVTKVQYIGAKFPTNDMKL